jgi:hypothetical protein
VVSGMVRLAETAAAPRGRGWSRKRAGGPPAAFSRRELLVMLGSAMAGAGTQHARTSDAVRTIPALDWPFVLKNLPRVTSSSQAVRTSFTGLATHGPNLTRAWLALARDSGARGGEGSAAARVARLGLAAGPPGSPGLARLILRPDPEPRTGGVSGMAGALGIAPGRS